MKYAYLFTRQGKDHMKIAWTHMTISFSYAYLNGFERLMVSSPCVHIDVQRPRRAMSPRMTAGLSVEHYMVIIEDTHYS